MTDTNTEQMIVGLDIGTTKVVAIVGKVNPDHTVEICWHRISPLKRPKKRRCGEH